MSGQPFRARFGFDADGRKLIDLADPTAGTDGVNLQTLRREAGMQMVARIGNLPSPNDPDPTKRPIDGRAYLIKMDLGGSPVNRVAVWDSSQGTTGGVATVDVIEPAADTAAIVAAAGTSDAGKPFNAGAGNGAVLDLTANPDGTITGTVTAAGSGYAIGDSMVVPAASLAFPGMTGDTTIVVTALAGASPTGGWRFVDPQIWTKALLTDADPGIDSRPGDLVTTTELGKEQLKVWTGSAWITLFDTQQIKGWIASLNLFEGTVQEVGGSAVGAIDFAALPDISDPVQGAANASHYWVFVGTPGYTIQGTEPSKIGTDLNSATLQVGDWLQVSSTTVGGTTTYKWALIGGDLLTRSRGLSLFGLQSWVAGNYEQGSLVTYLGDIYRAKTNILPAEGAPAPTGTNWEKVPLSGGVKSVASDGDLPPTAAASDVYLVINSAQAGGKAALFNYDTAAGRWVELGGSGTPLDLSGGEYVYGVGLPVGAITAWMAPVIPSGWLLCDGQAIDVGAYPELAQVLASNPQIPAGHVPDFRGSFLRGAGLNGNGIWGDAARAPGSYQIDATKMPNNGFGTNTDPGHDHGGGSGGYNNCWKSGACTGDLYTIESTHRTGIAGQHSHTITGGDPETRPVNFAVSWIIKAADDGMRLRAGTVILIP